MNSFERLLEVVTRKGLRVRPVRDGEAMVQCPVHAPDNNPSVHVTYKSEDKRTLVCDMHDHSRAGMESVLRSLGLTSADLFDSPSGINGYATPASRRSHDPFEGMGPSTRTAHSVSSSVSVGHDADSAARPEPAVFRMPDPTLDINKATFSDRFRNVCGILRTAPGHGVIVAVCPVCGGKLTLLYSPWEQGTYLHCDNCDPADIAKELGCYDQAGQIRSRANRPSVAVIYDNDMGVDYRYEDDLVVHRNAAKQITQFGAGTRRRGKTGTQDEKARTHVLLYASIIHKAVENGHPVFLVEGEKDANALLAIGHYATTAPMGANGVGTLNPSEAQKTLAGGHVIAVVDKDRQGAIWRQKVSDLLDGYCSITYVQASGDAHDASDAILTNTGFEYMTDDGIETVTDSTDKSHGYELYDMATVRSEQVSWLWPQHVPAGKITILDGDPGVGKSTIAMDIAARVSTGQDWPDGTTGCESAEVLILSAEDSVSDTIKPRLQAAGADLTRIKALHELLDHEGKPVDQTMDTLIPRLRTMLEQHRFKLVIIDVLMAYLGSSTDSHKDQDIRANVMSPLKQIAETYDCAFLLLRHLNKGQGSALYRGGGSIGISGAARSVMAAVPEASDGDWNLLGPVKLNIGIMPQSLRYRLTDVPEYGCARIEWGELTDTSIDDALSGRPQDDKPDDKPCSRQSQAEAFLEKCFRVNAVSYPGDTRYIGMRVQDVLKHADGAYTKNELSNARRRSKSVRYETANYHGDHWWIKPISEPHADDGPQTSPNDEDEPEF